jgi:hypothetical protein
MGTGNCEWGDTLDKPAHESQYKRKTEFDFLVRSSWRRML